MNTVIASFKIKPDKQSEAEEALREMGEAVEANEPGALAYAIHRNQKDPTEIVFFEMYTDGDAFKAHTASPHFQALQVKLAQLADLSTVKIDRLERFAGFVRG
ncbi:MAG: antibiotic biosynthesis monooxygenase family protein [Dehalococcoidia bacterium]